MQRLKSAAFVRVGVEIVGRLILVISLALLAVGCNQTGLTPTRTKAALFNLCILVTRLRLIGFG